MANPSKERIREIIHEVLDHMIVDYDSASPDVICKSDMDELVNKLYEECK